MFSDSSGSQLNSNLTDTAVSYTTSLNTYQPRVHKLAKHLWVEGGFSKPSGSFALNDTILTLSSPLPIYNAAGSIPCVVRNTASGATAIGAITCTNGTAILLTTCPDGYNEVRLLNSFPLS